MQRILLRSVQSEQRRETQDVDRELERVVRFLAQYPFLSVALEVWRTVW